LTALENVPEGHGAVKFAAQYQPACSRWEKKRRRRRRRRRDGDEERKETSKKSQAAQRRVGAKYSCVCVRADSAPSPPRAALTLLLTGHVVIVLVVVPPGQYVPAAQGRHWLGEVTARE